MEYTLKDFIDKLNHYYEQEGNIAVEVATPRHPFSISNIDIGTDGEGTLYIYGNQK